MTKDAADCASPRPAVREMFKDFVQIGVVVRDLERTLRGLSETFGLEPYRMVDYPPADRADMKLTYHGEPAVFSHRIAFIDLGPVELEIVQPLEGESGLTEFLAKHGEGLHHLRFNVPDLRPVFDHLEAHGVRSVMTGSGLRPGTEWAHLDTGDLVGFVVEVMNVLPGTSGRTPTVVTAVPPPK